MSLFGQEVVTTTAGGMPRAITSEIATGLCLRWLTCQTGQSDTTQLVEVHAKHACFLLVRLSSEGPEYRAQSLRFKHMISSSSDISDAAEMAKALSTTSLLQAATLIGEPTVQPLCLVTRLLASHSKQAYAKILHLTTVDFARSMHST